MDRPKLALILGGAACVWDDLERAKQFGPFAAVIAVNDAGAEFSGHVDIWATLHPEKLADWTARRKANGHSPAGMYAAHEGNTQQGRQNSFPLDYVTDYRWPGMSGSGSSGLFAVKVAMEHGYDRIILCGVPMQAAQAHFFDSSPWGETDSFTQAWGIAKPFIEHSTRSMSGMTRDLLGEPTAAWLTS